MPLLSWRKSAFVLVAGLSASACSTYGAGYGYGGGYGGGGYSSGVSLSYSGGNYYGWNGDYYYPGTGYYVYDRARRPYRWNNLQQRYWGDRQNAWRGHDRRPMRSNWREFRRYRR